MLRSGLRNLMTLPFGVMISDLVLARESFDNTLCNPMAYTLSGVCHQIFTPGATARMLQLLGAARSWGVMERSLNEAEFEAEKQRQEGWRAANLKPKVRSFRLVGREPPAGELQMIGLEVQNRGPRFDIGTGRESCTDYVLQTHVCSVKHVQ
jgi:hypothetical protein